MTDDVQGHVDRRPTNGVSYRLQRLEEDRKEHEAELRELSDRIDKLTLSLVGAVLTLAVFGLGIAVTLLTASGR